MIKTARKGRPRPRPSFAKIRRLLFLSAGFLAALYVPLRFSPYPELENYRERSYGLVLRDRNGAVLRVFPAGDGVKREWAPLDEIPAGARRIFIRAEDRRFYIHPGVDLISVAGSVFRNLRARRVISGASTITMQLARLMRPHDRGLGGKIREAWDALRLEARLSKNEILELWFNGIPFGSNIEGLPAMSRARFGRSVRELDDTRALLLAAVPRRPGYYDPAFNPEAAVEAAAALSTRCGLGIGPGLLRTAAAEASPDFQTEQKTPFQAPHFSERAAALFPGARFLTTTLDLELQRYAEDLLTTELTFLDANRVRNGAILAIENDTGAVRVYVGSASWFDDELSGKIDGVRVFNQPGSCLKPFLYAMALDRGFSPADILPDIPTVFGGSEAYIPSNFDRRFNGPVRLRLALASSLNIPAVYLLERLGVQAFEEYLAAFGFDSVASRMGTHGTGLALGNAEVSLEELVRAFSAFPRGGSPIQPCFVETTPAVEDGPMSSYAAWIVSDILADSASRFIGFGPAPALRTGFPSMFKTGTANQFQHIWALGASRRYTVGVWMGNFSGETVVGSTGSSIPARIASTLLRALEQTGGTPVQSSAGSASGGPAPGVESTLEVEICSLSGMAAGPNCPGTLREWFLPGHVSGTCTWHAGAPPAYPPEYRAWLSSRLAWGTFASPDESTPNSGGYGNSARGVIRFPQTGAVFYRDPSLPPEAQALRLETVGFGDEAAVYLNGELQGRLNYAGLFLLPLRRGNHTVTVEDSEGVIASTSFEVH
ncbi:MAG: penicillin-binding protein 1C [Treponema sp.]|nr:penicillin-binding protein 1C [Treponema sp.]